MPPSLGQSALVRGWNFLAPLVPRRVGSPDLILDELTEAAHQATGSSDFGGNSFREPLRRLVESIEDTADLHAFGRFYVKTVLTGLLTNRLRLADLWRRRPEIMRETITKPLVVLGLPRTGTTLLFNLLAQDPAHRSLTNWEAVVSQAPPEGSFGFESDPRRKRGHFLMKLQNHLAPRMEEIHTFRLDGPEECTPLLFQEFTTGAFAAMFNVPGYARWLETVSRTETYLHHKRILQTLQWKYARERWVLKSPHHMEAIGALLEAYPDACVIHTHREPVSSVPSYASLCAAFRSIYARSVSPRELGFQALTSLAADLNRYLAERRRIGEGHFFDVRYDALIEDPLGTVRRIYERFDFLLSEEAERRMRAFLERDREIKRGHCYSPEEYGLSPDLIRRWFKNYTEAFDLGVGVAQNRRAAGATVLA